MNFNGESETQYSMVFDPFLAGANICAFLEFKEKVSDRFSSNFTNFPRKTSPEGKHQHFGVGVKFTSLSHLEKFVSRLQFPELVS